MAELMVVNPRRSHRRRRRATRRRRRARARVSVAINRRPRRRRINARRSHRRHRRINARRHHRRRRHINPRLPGLSGGVGSALTQGIGIGLGSVGVALASDFIAKRFPQVAAIQTGLGNTALKAGIGLVALPMLLKMTPLTRRFVRPVMVGAGVAVALDLYTAYLHPALVKAGFAGLGEYTTEAGMGVYAPTRPDMEGLGWGQDSMYADSMYT